MNYHTLERTQFVPSDIDTVWEFISSPKNLKTITPDYMGFDITSKSLPEKMYPGMIISYTVSPLLGFKLNWMTEITHVKENEYFVDEQRFGPYALWHHQHHIKEVEGGVEMRDIVTYKLPFGILGRLMQKIMVRSKLEQIFEYRFNKMNELFPG
jgi:ligand-binding SRPBCC domain-containing protein